MTTWKIEAVTIKIPQAWLDLPFSPAHRTITHYVDTLGISTKRLGTLPEFFIQPIIPDSLQTNLRIPVEPDWLDLENFSAIYVIDQWASFALIEIRRTTV